jgi:hypothetical protein
MQPCTIGVAARAVLTGMERRVRTLIVAESGPSLAYIFRCQIRVSHSIPTVPASSLNWSPYFSDAACI